MLDSTAAPQDPTPPAEDDAADFAIASAERRLAVLARMADVGLKLICALDPDTAAADAAEVGKSKGRDPAEAYAQLSRAVRLTLTLEAKTIAELSDLKAGIVREREEERAHAAERQRADAGAATAEREYLVREIVSDAAEFEIADRAALSALYEAIDERLDEDEAYSLGAMTDRPLREVVEHLCRDLMLNPDWSRWDGEGWKVEWPSRPLCSVFNQPSAKPLRRLSG